MLPLQFNQINVFLKEPHGGYTLLYINWYLLSLPHPRFPPPKNGEAHGLLRDVYKLFRLLAGNVSVNAVHSW